MLSTFLTLSERKNEVKEIMNELTEVGKQQKQMPWARSLKDWKVLSHQAHTATKLKQLEEVTPLFQAYKLDQSAFNEDQIAKWIHRELGTTAKRKYRQALGAGQ